MLSNKLQNKFYYWFYYFLKITYVYMYDNANKRSEQGILYPNKF